MISAMKYAMIYAMNSDQLKECTVDFNGTG